MLRVLGIDVDDSTLARWRAWFAPTVQPFFVDDAGEWPTLDAVAETPEQYDTFALWRVDEKAPCIWLDETTFLGLTRGERAMLVRSQVRHGRGAVPSVRGWSDVLDGSVLRAQADGHRFVWWPSLVQDDAPHIFQRFIGTGLLTTRHREVRAATWKACADVVPGARDLAGTFPPGGGPNCFGTVLGAAGVPGAANECVLREPFDAWLADCCEGGGPDDAPGTVFVWRDNEGLVAHTAITLGDGWAFEKPSREWWTPRIVASVPEILRANRMIGWRLERHHIALSRRPV